MHRFFRYSTCTVTLKTGLGVTPGHRNRHVWNRSATYDFLLTFLGNYGPISYRFRDKVRFQSKIANGPVYFAPPMKGSSWNWVSALGGSKTRIMGLPGRERCLMTSSAVNTVHERGGQTDGHRPTAKTTLMHGVVW